MTNPFDDLAVALASQSNLSRPRIALMAASAAARSVLHSWRAGRPKPKPGPTIPCKDIDDCPAGAVCHKSGFCVCKTHQRFCQTGLDKWVCCDELTICKLDADTYMDVCCDFLRICGGQCGCPDNKVCINGSCQCPSGWKSCSRADLGAYCCPNKCSDYAPSGCH